MQNFFYPLSKLIICFVFCVLGQVYHSSAQSPQRRVYDLKENWKFHRGEVEDAFSNIDSDKAWQTVSVPHDWAIEGPFDKEIDKQIVAIEQNGEKIPSEKTGRTGALPYVGVGWYRYELPAVDLTDKRATLIFDGAMSDAHVYINGKKVGSWPYGYNSFYFDITDYLEDGDNTLAVRLENQPLSSRWYPGAGIYRPVQLVLSNEIGIDTWGVTVRTEIESDKLARVNVSASLVGTEGRNIKATFHIRDQEGTAVAAKTVHFDHAHKFIEDNIHVPHPNLWSPESPSLYSVTIDLYIDDVLVDIDSVRFGIRDVQVTAEGGFQLNGITRKIKGVCLHHDLGPLGAAVNKAALRRQLQMMKDMGADAIRTAHNMPAPWQMELCDEMGIMVVAESFDEWKYPKVKNGYNLLFDEWVEKDLVNLIRRHRNHPSIVMWSIGNEIPEQGRPEGGRMVKRLQDICHREDPTRLVTVGMDKIDNAINNGFAPILDVPGMNYRTHRYEAAYERLPQGFLLGSETASTVSSRGVYKLPAIEAQQKTYPDFQSSSYDLESCSWSNLPEDDWILQDDKSWVIGEFVWTGFDYLGEPTPYDEVWPSRSSYFGICDLAGIPKDRYYLYKSRWNDAEQTLHLLPHWNWELGDTVPVYCYTNYPEAELFVNGVSQGRRKKEVSSRLDRYRLRWNDVAYEPGILKVVAYDQNGDPAGEHEVHTAGQPAKIVLSPDRNVLRSGERDLAFVTVDIVDQDGHGCPEADIMLNFSVRGAGKFKAVCNGDATSLVPFQSQSMPTFKGKLVVIVEATDASGDIELEVIGEGLATSTLTLTSNP